MSQVVNVLLLDDVALSEGREEPAERTLPFSLDGTNYEIDLSSERIGQVLAGLEPFVERARTVRSAPRKSRPRSGRARTAEIRAWAGEHGIETKSRGRIPRYVEERYNREHS